MLPEVQHYVKQEVLVCVGDPIPAIRRTVSSIITTVVTKGRIEVSLSIVICGVKVFRVGPL